MKKIKPTLGISFGLPQQGGGGYPINPYGPNPHVNPYNGAIGGAGINLGLISVNPLVSIQVTKDDYGNKEIKPFVNLHVTPNNYLVHKFEDLLSYKKAVIFNKHKHYHVHKGHRPYHYQHHQPYYHYPHESYHDHHPGPIEYDGPSLPPKYDYDEYDFPKYDQGHNSYPDHHYPEQGSYFDDPLNYGGHSTFDDPTLDYKNSFHVRAFGNNSNYVPGNSLLHQYQQQYDNGQNLYGNLNYNQNDLDYGQNTDDFEYSNSRRGKSLRDSSPSNPIKFPSSRKRRDVTQDDTVKSKITKVKYPELQFPSLFLKRII